MHQDPIPRFQEALGRAKQHEPFDPTAAALATVDAEGMPSVRFVLVKSIDDRGFAFFTNLASPKARDLQVNPHAALVFHWSSLGIQVRVSGPVERVSDAEADAYFATRPRGSQLGAWASRQSQPIADRDDLIRQYQAQEQRFEGQAVQRPPFWSGFRIRPRRIEFWYSRESRLHERFLYIRVGEGWQVQVLQP